jgi:hypothetical protein
LSRDFVWKVEREGGFSEDIEICGKMLEEERQICGNERSMM